MGTSSLCERDKYDSKIQKYPTTQPQIERERRKGQRILNNLEFSRDLTRNKVIFGLGEQNQLVNHASLGSFHPMEQLNPVLNLFSKLDMKSTSQS